jgi:hypothetical protein
MYEYDEVTEAEGIPEPVMKRILDLSKIEYDPEKPNTIVRNIVPILRTWGVKEEPKVQMEILGAGM